MIRKGFKTKKVNSTNIKDKNKAGKIPHKKTEIDGIVFDSKMESEYYEYLKDRKSKGLIKDFSMQPQFLLQEKFMIIDGTIIYGSNKDFAKLKKKTKEPTISAISYKADFDITNLDDSKETIECKGQSTPEFELRKRMFIHMNPTVNYKVIIKEKGVWRDFYEVKAEKALKKRLKAKAKKLAEVN